MPALPRLLEAMYRTRLFTVDDAVERLGTSRAYVTTATARLRRSGHLVRVRRGLYAVVPLETFPKAPPANPYLIGSKLVRPYVQSHHTALELHGVAQSPSFQVTVSCPSTFRSFEFQGVGYRRVAARREDVELAAITRAVDDQPVKFTDREWTVADCCLRLDLAGGIEEALKSVGTFTHLDADHLYEVAGRREIATLYNRLGFVLSLFADRWHLDPGELRRFRSRVSPHVHYFGTRPGHGRLAREWNVMAPANLEEVLRVA